MKIDGLEATTSIQHLPTKKDGNAINLPPSNSAN